MKLAVSSRNAAGDGIGNDLGASPLIKLFNTAMPVDCAAVDNGAPISTGTLPVAPFAASAAGQLTLAGIWQATGNAGAGAGARARHYRIYTAAGVCKQQGIVSMPWVGSAQAALNQQWDNGGNVYICTTPGVTAATGGPTGTGTAIADGVAVWDYLGPKDLGIDNTSIAQNQVTTVNSYAITMGGA